MWHSGRDGFEAYKRRVTFNAEGPSGLLETLSGATVSEKAGQGLECSNFFVLWNNGTSHFEQQ